MRKKIWSISGALTQDDIEWVRRSNLECTLGEQHYLDFVEIGTNKHTKIPGKLEPSEIVTTTEKEEVWLKLYFADRAFLLAEEFDYKYY